MRKTARKISPLIRAGLMVAVGFSIALGTVGAGEEEPGVVYKIQGDHTSDGFGIQLAALGDIDGDGVPDFAASATQYWSDSLDRNLGYVRIVSGKTGREIRTLRRTGGFFHQLKVMDDLDGDGIDELLVDGSEVRIYSPGTGALLYRFSVGHLGIGVAGDLDQDESQDLVFGVGLVPLIDGRYLQKGEVFAYSFTKRQVLWERFGLFEGNRLGDAVHGVPDVNGDGVPDVIAVEKGPEKKYERVRVLSGRDGESLRVVGEDLNLFPLGRIVVTLGDLNGDGKSEIAIGGNYPEDQPTSHGRGVVLILDGGTLEVFRRYEGIDVSAVDRGIGFDGDWLGGAMANPGDVDADGVDDILLAAPRFGVSQLRLFSRIYLRSGRTDELLMTYDGRHGGSAFVEQLSGLGDVDGDGRPEFVVGSPGSPEPGEPGEVSVVRFNPDLPSFVRGDVNLDGRVDLSDAIDLAVKLFFDTFAEVSCLEALDSNGDGEVDPDDVVSLTSHLFLGFFAPPPPFPECSSYVRLHPPATLSCERSTCSP